MPRFVPLKQGQRFNPVSGWKSTHLSGFIAAFVIVSVGAAAYLRQDMAVQGANVIASLVHAGGPAASSSQPASSPPQLPKVALLFLTRGPMALGPVWRMFLAAAAATVDGTRGGDPLPRRVSPSWQALFSVYVHPPPDFAFHSGSIFSGHEVSDRVAVQWGAVTEALGLRALLRAALADPLNQRFVLLSESCVPLYPPTTIYWQLMSEMRSRITACPTDWTMPSRYQAGMADFGIRLEDWRKASQWTSLLRRHAEMVVADDTVLAAFARECRGDRDHPKFCIASEHYLPVLLATLGLEGECECGARLTYDKFDGQTAHPRRFTAEEATTETLAQFRGGNSCMSQYTWGEAAKAAVRTALQRPSTRRSLVPVPLVEGLDGSSTGGGSGGSSGGREGLADGVSAAAAGTAGFRALVRAGALHNITVMSAGCPLFARKIAREGAVRWVRFLQPTITA